MLLIIGFWIPSIAIVGAILFIIEGLGGILSHISVKDGVKENIPILALTGIAIIFLIAESVEREVEYSFFTEANIRR